MCLIDNIQKNVSLKDYCTFKIGGSAKFFFIAKTTNDLIEVCKYCKENKIKYKIIGLGANLLFDDRGYDGMIVVNRCNNIVFDNKCVYVEGGANISNLIVKCCLRNLCGFEKLSGIPSTVAGAITNSLGAFETNFCDFVEYVECYHKDNLNEKLTLSNKECLFSYRSSIFKCGDYIITLAKLKLNEDEKSIIHEHIMQAVQKKKESQPLDKYSAGSVFKRGNIIPAQVIDILGLKGTRFGGAEISTKHAGFIINSNNATSNDVKALISLIRKRIKAAYNENLETEIEFVEF